MGRRLITTFLIVLAFFSLPLYALEPLAKDGKVVINEINSEEDWVELANIGDEEVSLDGYFITDDKLLERKSENKTYALKDVKLLPNEYIVLEKGKDFDFGLGKSDSVFLFDKDNNEIDSFSYTSASKGTWSRLKDGTFVDSEITKGRENNTKNLIDVKVVLNEINSSPDDWVEIVNLTNDKVDVSGFEVRDNSDDHRWKFPENSYIQKDEALVIDANSEGLIYDDEAKEYKSGTFSEALGLGSGDSVRLYDNKGNLLDSYSWTEHAQYNNDKALASFGRYPDKTGLFTLTKETKGKKNEIIPNQIVINEIESNGDETDWVEIINIGASDVDISSWYLLDNDPEGHKAETTPVSSKTILKPGEIYVFDQNKDFTFGLGKADSVTIYDKNGSIIDSYSWKGHANGVYARISDGEGEMVDFSQPTKGKRNNPVSPVVISEVQSNDPDGSPDWIELANPTSEAIDISGIVIKDSKDKDPYTIKENTVIEPNGFLVIKEDESGVDGFKFGLGKGDSVRLFENGELIASTSWPEETHTSPTWALYPNSKKIEYRNSDKATPGEENSFSDIPKTISWPGDNTIVAFDNSPLFLEDSSGLDFANGSLYAVDNGSATFWILNEDKKTGELSFMPGFEKGKRFSFKKDGRNSKAKGPDSEGITVDDSGLVYIASERDNSNKGVNYNTILCINPDTEASILVAEKEWDLTNLLPQVSANMGLEAVEWVDSSLLGGGLIDENTNKAFDISNYPNSINSGIFFTALEDNGHVYAFVLNSDESATLIADIDSYLGGAMALDYDRENSVLWVGADDGYGNMMAQIRFNGTTEPTINFVAPPTTINTKANTEGFAISYSNYVQDGQKHVYRFQDGVKTGSLTIGSIDTTY